MKCKCGNILFTIQIIPCCSDCSENPAYDDEGDRIYDQKEIDEKGLERSGVEENGECGLDTAFGSGCYMFACSKCNLKKNLPVSDSCG